MFLEVHRLAGGLWGCAKQSSVATAYIVNQLWKTFLGIIQTSSSSSSSAWGHLAPVPPTTLVSSHTSSPSSLNLLYFPCNGCSNRSLIMYANFLHPSLFYYSTVTSPFVSCLGGVAITCEQRIRLISLSSAFFSTLSLDPDLNAGGQRLSHSVVACCRPPVRSRLLRLFILGGGETEESPLVAW